MTDYKIVIIDDNEAVLKTLRRILKPEFGNVATLSRPSLLPTMLSLGNIDVVLLDMNFSPGTKSGEESIFWLNNILNHSSPPSVVVITAFADIDLAISSFKGGAVDFVIKPWDNDKLITTIKQAAQRKMNEEFEGYQPDISQPDIYISFLLKKYARMYSKLTPDLDVNARLRLNDLLDAGYLDLLELYVKQTVLLSKDVNKSLERSEYVKPTHFTLEEIESQLIRFVLKKNNRHIATSAEELKISRQTLYNKIKKYQL